MSSRKSRSRKKRANPKPRRDTSLSTRNEVATANGSSSLLNSSDIIDKENNTINGNEIDYSLSDDMMIREENIQEEETVAEDNYKWEFNGDLSNPFLISLALNEPWNNEGLLLDPLTLNTLIADLQYIQSMQNDILNPGAPLLSQNNVYDNNSKSVIVEDTVSTKNMKPSNNDEYDDTEESVETDSANVAQNGARPKKTSKKDVGLFDTVPEYSNENYKISINYHKMIVVGGIIGVIIVIGFILQLFS